MTEKLDSSWITPRHSEVYITIKKDKKNDKLIENRVSKTMYKNLLIYNS